MERNKVLCTLSAAVIMTGTAMYCGGMAAAAESAAQVQEEVIDADIGSCDIKIVGGPYFYTGSAIKPAMTVRDGKTLLKEGVDYKCSYADNTNAGTAKVNIEGIGSYSGTVQKEFDIIPVRLEGYTVTVSQSEVTKNGQPQTPAVTVSHRNSTLRDNVDYTVAYSNNVNAGTATVTVTGTGNYAGTIRGSFEIVEDAPAEVTGMKAVSTTDSSITLGWNKVNNIDGYIIYFYNKSTKSWGRYKKVPAGTTTLTVTGLNDGEAYAFSARAYKMNGSTEVLSPTYKNFKTSTNPKQVSFEVALISKGSATVKWTRVKGATSYAVYYKASMNDGWKKVTVVNNKTSSYTLRSGLKYGTKGWVTVRAFRNYESVIRGSEFYLRSLTPVKRDINDLRKSLVSKIGTLPGEWSVYVKNLRTNETLTINNKRMYPASQMKLFCMTAVYEKIEKGEIREADVKDLLSQLISYSSNEAFNILVLRYDKYMVRNWIQANGYNDTNESAGFLGGPNYAQTIVAPGSNYTTVQDVGRLFEDIYFGRCVSPTASKKMLDLLIKQHYRYKIPDSLPKGVKTANKTGDVNDYTHDCAIVYLDGEPYVVAIMCRAPGQGYGCAKHLRTLSRMVYDYFLYNK